MHHRDGGLLDTSLRKKKKQWTWTYLGAGIRVTGRMALTPGMSSTFAASCPFDTARAASASSNTREFQTRPLARGRYRTFVFCGGINNERTNGRKGRRKHITNT